MVYHKTSLNYGVCIMGYMRLRVALHALRRWRHWEVDRSRIETTSPTGLRGNEDPAIWEVHYQSFLREGWSYLRAERFLHHATDGPECPVARAFTRRGGGASLPPSAGSAPASHIFPFAPT